MAGMSELREKAKKLGIPAKAIRSAETAAELRELISDNSDNGSKPRKKAVAKAAGKKRGRGRPKGSTNARKASTSSKSSTRKVTTRRASSNSNGNGGRNLLSKVKWSRTDGWNPREGSVPDVIVNAIRKAKGDRDAAFKVLVKKIDSLVPRKTRNGRTRDKEERRNYLRYLINRNAWAFAIATGQHEKAEDRAEYGTAGTGQGTFKRAGSRKSNSGKSASKSTGKSGGRKTASSGRKRGRPKGSKNKASAKAAGRKAASRKRGK
jgi:hypothetical protein